MPSGVTKVKHVGRYELGRTLGEGTFAKVKVATDTETNTNYAIKIVDKAQLSTKGLEARLKREIAVMKVVRHPHVVNLIEVLASKSSVFIVMEFVTGGDLLDYITAHPRLTEDEARTFFQQLIDGVAYCHERGVCHRDIKPENILLDGEGRVKISDFGLSALPEHFGQAMDNLQTTCGTPNYVAPEVLRGVGYDGRSADIWSCGVVLFVLAAARMPFDDPQLPNLFLAIASAKYKAPDDWSSGLRDLVGRILVPDPRKRADVAEIKKHPWFLENYSPSPAEEPDLAAIRLDEPEDWTEVDVVVGEQALPKPVIITAFDLICGAAGLDLNALFQKRGDVVMRQTRFVSMASPDVIFQGVTTAAKELGFRVPAVSKNFKIRIEGHGRRGVVIAVVQVFEMCAGIFMVEMSKIKGDGIDFHALYNDLVAQPACKAIAAQ